MQIIQPVVLSLTTVKEIEKESIRNALGIKYVKQPICKKSNSMLHLSAYGQIKGSRK